MHACANNDNKRSLHLLEHAWKLKSCEHTCMHIIHALNYT